MNNIENIGDNKYIDIHRHLVDGKVWNDIESKQRKGESSLNYAC